MAWCTTSGGCPTSRDVRSRRAFLAFPSCCWRTTWPSRGPGRPRPRVDPDARRAIDDHVRLLLAWTEAINLTASPARPPSPSHTSSTASRPSARCAPAGSPAARPRQRRSRASGSPSRCRGPGVARRFRSARRPASWRTVAEATGRARSIAARWPVPKGARDSTRLPRSDGRRSRPVRCRRSPTSSRCSPPSNRAASSSRWWKRAPLQKAAADHELRRLVPALGAQRGQGRGGRGGRAGARGPSPGDVREEATTPPSRATPRKRKRHPL